MTRPAAPLREQLLRLKPRIVVSLYGGLWVERRDETGKIQSELCSTFPEAIAQAHEWAGPKP